MSKIKIDSEKCIRCGTCVRDCITYSLEQDANGIAKVTNNGDSNCISCQHCFAICPVGAITFEDKIPSEASQVSFVNPEELLNHIKSRRSIRQYKKDEISKELLLKLKEMLPHIPTGCNYNGLHFSIVETRTAMDYIREYVRKTLLKLVSNKFTNKYSGKFLKFKTAFEKGEDIIFRDAPHLIVVSSHIHAPCANVDPIIALSYIELYAQSLGLGTCWCGFAQACFKLMPKLSKMVGIPDGYKPVYAMLLGYSEVNYERTILPEEFPISEIVEISDVELSLSEKLRRYLLNFIR